MLWNLLPLSQETFRADHMHQELGRCMGQWFPVRPGAWRTRGSSWSPAGLCLSHTPGEGRGQAGCGRKAQTKIPIVKALSDETDLGSWQEVIPWVRAGIWISQVHGQEQTLLQCNPQWNKLSSQEKGWGNWGDLDLSEASSSSSDLVSTSATVWTKLRHLYNTHTQIAKILGRSGWHALAISLITPILKWSMTVSWSFFLFLQFVHQPSPIGGRYNVRKSPGAVQHSSGCFTAPVWKVRSVEICLLKVVSKWLGETGPQLLTHRECEPLKHIYDSWKYCQIHILQERESRLCCRLLTEFVVPEVQEVGACMWTAFHFGSGPLGGWTSC